MPRPNVHVDRIRRIDLPSSPLVTAQARGPLGHASIHLFSSSSLLDLNSPQATIWECILDDLRQRSEPVYIETDPRTNVITQLLLPQPLMVTDIAPAPVGNLHEITLEISHARHYLNTANPDYAQLLAALTVARQQGTMLLITETPNDHHIIDVRPDPAPFVVGPAMVVIPTGPAYNPPASGGIPLTQAQQLFALVAGQAYIPFLYPDDGCWARAHEMGRLILAAGTTTRKVWIYGNLVVDTRNHPTCRVRWKYHVALAVLVDTDISSEIYVIDPSLFTAPVPQSIWVSIQQDPQATVHDTDLSVYYRSLAGQFSYDQTYSQTQRVLARYRLSLAHRSVQDGPPPYSHCP